MRMECCRLCLRFGCGRDDPVIFGRVVGQHIEGVAARILGVDLADGEILSGAGFDAVECQDAGLFVECPGNVRVSADDLDILGGNDLAVHYALDENFQILSEEQVDLWCCEPGHTLECFLGGRCGGRVCGRYRCGDWHECHGDCQQKCQHVFGSFHNDSSFT